MEIFGQEKPPEREILTKSNTTHTTDVKWREEVARANAY
jgi:hypothetical protein